MLLLLILQNHYHLNFICRDLSTLKLPVQLINGVDEQEAHTEKTYALDLRYDIVKGYFNLLEDS